MNAAVGGHHLLHHLAFESSYLLRSLHGLKFNARYSCKGEIWIGDIFSTVGILTTSFEC